MAVRETTAMLQVAAGFIREVRFNAARMSAAAETGYLNAMAAATYLVGKGIPFRRAHELVGQAVLKGLEKQCELQQIPLDELRQLSPEFAADFYPAVSLRAVLACHDVVGGTAPAQVLEALEAAEQRLKSRQEMVHAGA
jgi:argininosuccinate lyase